ncbi:MAG TPA: HAD family phosphatase [Vicinamibacterales bacterium]|nr:HAD family phosphatase [Vicinamibacterales bacterium]
MQSLAAVVLDMDGLLIDTEPLYKESWQLTARELGFDLTDRFYETLVGRNNPESEAAIACELGSAFPIDTFRARWPAVWRERAARDGLPVKPGATELLDFLNARRVPVALATSSDREFTQFTLVAAGLADRLLLRVTGEEVARGKPAPDIYREAARRLGVPGSSCVACEDSEAGTLSASGAGMRVLLVPDIQPPSPAAVRTAAAVLSSLHEAVPVLARWLDESGD